MKIKELFAEDINRPINGVVQVEQKDETTEREVKEYVVTSELKKYFLEFFNSYGDSFNTPTILIMGGLDRGHSFDELDDHLKNVKYIICYGQTKERIKAWSKVDCKVVENLEEATKKAYELSEPGDTILLSPACASWDQFNSFEERGTLFKEVINKL